MMQILTTKVHHPANPEAAKSKQQSKDDEKAKGRSSKIKLQAHTQHESQTGTQNALHRKRAALQGKARFPFDYSPPREQLQGS